MDTVELEKAITLDKRKHFGVVTPPEHDAHFCQDGFYFNQHGKLVTHPLLLDDAGRKRAEKLLVKRTADAAAAKARAEAYAKAGVDDDGSYDDDDDAKAREEKDAFVDLIAWGTGKRQYPFYTIVKAFKDQHSVIIMKADDGVQWLIENNMISEDAARK